MRTAFFDEVLSQASQDERIWLIAGDLGYSVLEPFIDRFPERFVNAGVAEQNMMGMAAGLALSGKRPFIYSIANFPVMRCLEQIRNDVCYHELPVRIVSVGGGLVYGTSGYSHHGVEDLSVMRSMPNMTVIAPADPVEARLAARALSGLPGPAYVRLSKAGDPVLHTSEPSFEIGKAIVVREGDDVALVSTGTALAIALDAAERLSADGISATVMSMPTVSPIDSGALHAAAGRTGLIATIEEHSTVGGLHAAVLEVLATRPVPCLQFALDPKPVCVAGSTPFLSSEAGLTATRVAETVAARLAANRSS